MDRLQGRLRDLADEKAQAVSDCRTALDDSQTLQGLIDSMPEPPGS